MNSFDIFKYVHSILISITNRFNACISIRVTLFNAGFRPLYPEICHFTRSNPLWTCCDQPASPPPSGDHHSHLRPQHHLSLILSSSFTPTHSSLHLTRESQRSSSLLQATPTSPSVSFMTALCLQTPSWRNVCTTKEVKEDLVS